MTTNAQLPDALNIIAADYGNNYDTYQSTDGGDNWTVIGASLDEPLALSVSWGDAIEPNTLMVANDTGATNEVLFSPNNRASQTDEATVTIQGATDIVGVVISG